MGGSGGGGGYFPRGSDSLQHKIDDARKAEHERLEGGINDFLTGQLSKYNDRDADLTNDRIEQASKVLDGIAEIDRLLYGGSIAKHTYVDGLSDADALIVLDRKDTRGLSSDKVLDLFYHEIFKKLPREDVTSITKGNMAVTISYSDGNEVQLLPAVQCDKLICIPNAEGTGWNKTDPHIFQKTLTKHNKDLSGTLVPTIKLVKSLISDLPEQQRISGHHIEALAIDAAKTFKGTAKPKDVLLHVLSHAAERTKSPINDITGQSNNIDDSLGSNNSPQRLLVSQAIAGIRRRLESATSLAQWKAMFGEKDNN